MSRETDNRALSRCLNGEGCQAPRSNSRGEAHRLGEVSEDDRTGRATKVSRENSSDEAVPRPAVQGGIQQGGFKFLGFSVNWRPSKRGRGYPHIEPHLQSQTKLRQKVREKLDHWTLWRAADEVIPELNRVLKGWGGCFHYANSARVLDRINHFVANGVQRWLRRKSGCGPYLWTTKPREDLQERWGLYRLPTWAAWKRARRSSDVSEWASESRMRENRPPGSMRGEAGQ